MKTWKVFCLSSVLEMVSKRLSSGVLAQFAGGFLLTSDGKG